jgi:hypothetical protein
MSVTACSPGSTPGPGRGAPEERATPAPGETQKVMNDAC